VVRAHRARKLSKICWRLSGGPPSPRGRQASSRRGQVVLGRKLGELVVSASDPASRTGRCEPARELRDHGRTASSSRSDSSRADPRDTSWKTSSPAARAGTPGWRSRRRSGRSGRRARARRRRRPCGSARPARRR
jgi:hypothetical protein